MKIRRPEQPVWYSIVILFLCVVLATFWNFVYTNSVQHESDKQWCDFLLAITVSAPPPSNPRAVANDIAFKKFLKQKGCTRDEK